MTGPSTNPPQGDCGEVPPSPPFPQRAWHVSSSVHVQDLDRLQLAHHVLLSLFLVLRLLVSASRLLPPLHLEPGRSKEGFRFRKALRTRLIRAAPTRLQLLHFTRTLLLFA